MSCYHPLLGIPSGEKTKNGKEKYRITSIDKKENALLAVKNDGCVLIPCGKCIGCRLDYSRRWADRMILELETQKKAVFITLTYNDESLKKPRLIKETFLERVEQYHYYDLMRDSNVDGKTYASVDVRDCQLFLKRLRKSFKDKKIRFFLSSEYGPLHLRPHYHLIVFGIDRDDIGDCVKWKYEKAKSKNFEWSYWLYLSERIASIWNNGFITVADVNWKTCAYVARYVTKKLSDDMPLSPSERNCKKEFVLMSRRPGIGYDYLSQHPDCLNYSTIPITTKSGGIEVPVPSYYLKKLNEESENNPLYDPDRYAKICNERRMFCTDSQLLALSKTTLPFLENLEVKEKNKKQNISTLQRKNL